MADQPKSYWQQRYEKARAEGTWDHAPQAISARPKGSMTRTAKSSRKLAIVYSIVAVTSIVLATLTPEVWQFLYAVMWSVFASLCWRSYRILQRFEAGETVETKPAILKPAHARGANPPGPDPDLRATGKWAGNAEKSR